MRSLVDRQSSQRSSLVAQVLAIILPFWKNFKDWNDPDLVTANAARTSTVMDMAIMQMRLQTRAYYDNYFLLIGDAESAAVELPPVTDDYPRDGISELEVYSRPAREYVKVLDEMAAKYKASQEALSASVPDSFSPPVAPAQPAAPSLPESPPAISQPSEEALTRAMKRLEDMATMDLQLARRDEALTVIKNTPKVVGFRRVIHPEMSQSGTCGMCLVASRQFYTKEELEPIHYYCKCEVLPITSEHDPGKKMNAEDERKLLDGFYGDAGGNTIDELSNTRYKLDEHGELGLVMAPVKKTAKPDSKGVVPAVKKNGKIIVPEKVPQAQLDAHQIKVLTETLGRLEARRTAGEPKMDAPIAWHQNQIAFLKNRLASS